MDLQLPGDLQGYLREPDELIEAEGRQREVLESLVRGMDDRGSEGIQVRRSAGHHVGFVGERAPEGVD